MFKHLPTTHSLRNLNPLFGVVVVVLVFVLLLPHLTHAQATSGVISSIGTGIEKMLWVVVNVLFGWLVWVGGMLLDTAVNQYVIGFGTMYTDASGLGFTIDRLWVIVRDIFNLTFIFGLVYIGLRMIFDSSNSSTRKMLVTLIMAALLVNFSLFITKFVIDFSNIAAAQIASAFQVNGTGAAQVSGRFMRLMGLTGLLNTGADAGFNFQNMTGGAGIGYILGTMILYIISAFVFLGGALLLMIRFAVLNIYMVLSPLMFIGWVFPGAASVTRDYWKGFMSRAFFAPAYLLMLYLAQSILSTFAITAQGASLSSIFTERGQATFSTVVPPFVLTAVFLIAAIIVAQKMSDNGGSAIISLQNNLMGKAKGSVRSAVMASTWVPRTAVRTGTNRAGNTLLKNFNKVQAIADKNAGSGGFKGGLATGASLLLKRNAVDRNVRAGFEKLKKAEFGTGTTYDKEEESARKIQANINQTNAELGRDKTFESTLEAIKNSGTSTEKLTAALEDLGKTIKSMSKSEKEGIDLEKLKDKHIAVHLSDGDIENIEKTGKYSAAEIQTVKDARKAGLIAVAAGGNTFAKVEKDGTVSGYDNTDAATIDRRSSLLGQSVTDIGKLPADVFKQSAMAGLITPQMLQERLRNGISSKEQDEIRTSLQTFLATADESKRNAWRKWTDSTTYGSSFGLTIPAANTQAQPQGASLTWPTIDANDQE